MVCMWLQNPKTEFNFRQPSYKYMLVICKYTRLLSEIFSASSSNLISLALWIKLFRASYCFFFCAAFSVFFSYVVGVLVTKLFHCYRWYGLAMQHTRSICDHLFYLWQSSQLAQKHYIYNNRKQPQSHFTKKILTENSYILLFWCIACTTSMKISTIRPVFSDYLFVSYDCD